VKRRNPERVDVKRKIERLASICTCRNPEGDVESAGCTYVCAYEGIKGHGVHVVRTRRRLHAGIVTARRSSKNHNVVTRVARASNALLEFMGGRFLEITTATSEKPIV